MSDEPGKPPKTRRPRHRYGPEDVARVLAAHAQLVPPGSGPTVGMRRIAAETGVPKNSADRIIQAVRERQQSVMRTLRPYNRQYHEALIQDRVIGILERADPDSEAVSAKELQSLAIAHGCLTDKMLLLSGMPTEIHAHLVEHRVNLADLASRLASALGGQATTSSILGHPEGETALVRQDGHV